MVNVVDGVLWKTKNWLGDGTSKNSSVIKNASQDEEMVGKCVARGHKGARIVRPHENARQSQITPTLIAHWARLFSLAT
jgi:hypothetical protein